jgi:hypothetical protein
VHREWQRRVQAEYRSAAITAQLVHWMIQAGLDEQLVATGLRIVGDELAHARLSHDCLVALGGDDTPQQVHAAELAEPADQGVLAALIDSLVDNFCFGETLAVPLFKALRDHTTHPAAEPVLTRVLRDEAVHRAFGWSTLDALLPLDPDGVRARIEARLPSTFERFRASYAPEGADEPLTPEEIAAGLMPVATYREVFWATVPGLHKRFAQRGIQGLASRCP